MQAYIAVAAPTTPAKSSDVPNALMSLYTKTTGPCRITVSTIRAGASSAGPPQHGPGRQHEHRGLRGFLFQRLHHGLSQNGPRHDPAAKTDEENRPRPSQIPGHDLQFSIKGIGAIVADGKRNIPDGEVFSCPSRTPSRAASSTTPPPSIPARNLRMSRSKFRTAKSSKPPPTTTSASNEILDTDPGARYNRRIFPRLQSLHPQSDVRHFVSTKKSPAPSISPPARLRGRRQRQPFRGPLGHGADPAPEWGGGEVWFDGRLIRKDGLFQPCELQPLNPNNLK